MSEALTDIALWSRKAHQANTTKRSKSWYNRAFAIADDESVLDLGAGLTKHRPPNFVSLDYYYAAHPTKPEGHRNVAGLFQALPFQSEVFDRAIASWSYYHVWEGAIEAVSEALRVVKPGGLVQFTPAVRKIDIIVSARQLEKQDRARLARPRPRIASGLMNTMALAPAVYSVNEMFGKGLGFVEVTTALGVTATIAALRRTVLGLTDPKVLTVPRLEEYSNPRARDQFAADLLTAFAFTAALTPSRPAIPAPIGSDLPATAV